MWDQNTHLQQGWLLMHDQLGEALEHFHLYVLKEQGLRR